MTDRSSPSEEFPSYLRLHRTGQLAQRVQQALAGLESCQVCPWACGVNRLQDQRGACRIGRRAKVASFGPHHGEEDCLRGWNGSGTIFFAGCNLRCVFCQNFDISQLDAGAEVGPSELAAMMLDLQRRGCHNINLVTPEHVVPQVLEALLTAVEAGLRIPLVYNTSAFDSSWSLNLLDGLVDIYMPDFKFWDPVKAQRYLKCPRYPQVARESIRQMHQQVGDLDLDADGLTRRGLLVRHLVMPDALDDTTQIMNFLTKEISPHTYVNIMDQYRPCWQVRQDTYPQINRPTTPQEWQAAVDAARAAGLYRFDQRTHRFF